MKCARKMNPGTDQINWKYDGNVLEDVLEADTKLMRAIRLQNSELAFILLDSHLFNEISLNDADINGFTAVSLSILYFPGIELLSPLIRKNAKVSGIEDIFGCSPLMLACLKNRTEAAKFLLDVRLKDNQYALGKDDINKVDNSGKHSALTLAIEKGMNDVAKILIERGSSLDIKWQKEEPKSLLICALKRGREDVGETILDRLKKQMIHSSDPHNMDPILEVEKYVNMKNENGETALGLAFRSKYSMCIKLILSCGGNIYQQGKLLPITAEDYKNFLDDQIRIYPENPDLIIFDYSKIIYPTPSQVDKEENMKTKLINLDDSSATCRNLIKWNPIQDELKLIKDLTCLSSGHKALITHPLIKALLITRWKRIEPFWIIYMICKLVFMAQFINIGIGTLGLQAYHCNDTNIKNGRANIQFNTIHNLHKYLFFITGSFGSQVFEEGYGDHCIVFAVLWILFSCVELIQVLFSLKVLIFL